MNFPTSPSAGDLFTINNITYKFNNPGWEIHKTTADTITTDCGVVSFAGQSTAPATISGKAQLYGKNVLDISSSEVLYHFSDNIEDSSGNGRIGTGSTVTPVTYIASGAGASGTGFGQAAVFNGASHTQGGDAYILFDDMGIGTGDFTVEFWVRFNGTGNEMLICTDANAPEAGVGHFAVFRSGSSITTYYWAGTGNPLYRYHPFTPSSGIAINTWYHYAACRNGTDYKYFWGVAGNANGIRGYIISETAWDIGGVNHEWVIGRHSNGLTSGYGTYNLDGQVDELRISKLAKYNNAVYPLETAPFSDVASVTTEGSLSLHFDNSLVDTGSSASIITHPGSSNGAPAYVAPGKFGSHALHLDSTGGSDFLVVPTSTDLQFDSDFTVDFWLKWGDSTLVNSTDYHCPISNKQLASLSSNLGLGLLWLGANYTTASRKRRFVLTMAGSNSGATYCYGDFEYYGSGTNPAHVSDAALVSDFHHIAICRTNGLVEMWMNGIRLSVEYTANSDGGALELVTTATVNGDNKDYYIGREVLWNNVADSVATHINDWDGYIDELRMVKGSAEFGGSTFTPPSRAHGSSLTKIIAMNSDGVESPLT